MSAPVPAIDDISMAPNNSSQELKNLHLEQECSISAQHKNSKMDGIPSPTAEVTITRPKKHKQSSGPIKKSKHEHSQDDGLSVSGPPRGFKVKLMMIQEEELSSGRAAHFSAIYKSSDDSNCSSNEAEQMRRTEKMADSKEAKTFTSNGEWGWPLFQHYQEGVSIFWRLLQGG
jgi:hypothetical protein